jgi:hypothetical protein
MVDIFDEQDGAPSSLSETSHRGRSWEAEMKSQKNAERKG